ncbi:autotransporter domain-containing protein [Morganella morganii]|uniref:autotransporter domain-containing protein n=1 Tax=Morganella morganii TaxID=582 RepID=UPI00092121A6|nr:autotransporter domain-containing protein [Morganella morganii]SHL27187.1 probable extracellular repeat, HAF family [Morganella morganii]
MAYAHKKHFNKTLLALLLTSQSTLAFSAMDYEVSKIKDIGQSSSVSADGKVIAGTYEISNNNYRPFIIIDGNAVDLSKYAAGNNSIYISGLSADGNTATGYIVDENDKSNSKMYIYDINTDTVNIPEQQVFTSVASLGISGDGKTVIGIADEHAFRFTGQDGITLLNPSETATSTANGVNYDGSVIVGRFISGSGQAFKYTNDKGMVSLGTLREGNAGTSGANAVSADGLVTVGWSNISEYETHAMSHTDKDGMRDLGTLKKDNSGYSSASSVSHDGQFIVGSSDNEDDIARGFVYVSGEKKMYELKPIQGSFEGESSAEAISADGKVVAGYVQNDNNETTAVLWKLDYKPPMTPLEPSKPVDPTKPLTPLEPSKPVTPTEPLTPPEPTKPVNPASDPIYIIKTRDTLTKMADSNYQILDLYQTALYNLAESRCQMGDDNYCAGLFTQYDNVHQNNRVATGVFGSFRLPAENWTLGASLNFAVNTRLADGYDTRGNNHPGVGAWLRYQENKDNSGFNSELSAAFLQQDLEITRQEHLGTENGKGNSDIKGYYVKFTTGYGITVSENTLVTPLAAIKYHNVTRAGYTESNGIDFPATYGRAGNKNLDLQLGVDLKHQFNKSTELDAGIGADIKLNHKRDAFTGHIQYVNDGAYIYDRGDSQSVKPYARAGVNYFITENSTLRGDIGYHTTDYRNDGLQVGLSYSYHW